MIAVRRIIRVTGVVQGVGFRPFVCRLARAHGLAGWVRNTSGSVEIDAEGPPESVELFLRDLAADAPALAKVESVAAIEADPVGYSSFEILDSRAQTSVDGVIPADVATCLECLHEITDASDRRFAYPFTNCTNCGPRFTIVRCIPYDRANTTMSAFAMCERCATEYADPADRRFHAEPIACPECGPCVWLEKDGVTVRSDALEVAGRLLRTGKIVAIKGIGGFHLACDAANDEAVRTLRRRKGRVAKPFALMVRDLEEAERLCELNESARELILSHRRPIVLARRREATGISEAVAPGNTHLGLMLPYAPLHHLLFEHSPPALVMTSGNLAEEPLVFTNTSARTKLAHLADAFLMHDRDIHVPCDDSVVRPMPAGPAIPIRRARGYVPDAIEMPVSCDCILGVGAEQKNTFCLAWDNSAVPSQHIGDLDTAETLDYYRYAVSHFLALFERMPTVVAHDLHPDYLSTRYALELPAKRLVAVQHHHAHIAACLAENGRTERCIGLALDGTGYGTDGTIWGGEILIGDLADFQRVGRFAQVRMPGGEASIRDPRRMAMAYLHAAFGSDCLRIAERLGLEFTKIELELMLHQLHTGLNSPITSSAGRLFDAVSAICGVCRERTYEGQPAAELEMAADESCSETYRGMVEMDGPVVVLDTIPIVRAAVEDCTAHVDNAVISARFHNSLVALLTEACRIVREQSGIEVVALSGGVFQNAIIATRLRETLQRSGFEVLVHGIVPPNDACISLGQVAVAAARYGS